MNPDADGSHHHGLKLPRYAGAAPRQGRSVAAVMATNPIRPSIELRRGEGRRAARGAAGAVPEREKRRAAVEEAQLPEVGVLRQDRKPAGLRVFPQGNVVRRCERYVTNVLGAGEEIGELYHEPRREVLIEEQLQAAGTDNRRRSRSAANARQARMSSEVRSGKSASICASDMPDARYSSTSYTVMRSPRMHGLPPLVHRSKLAKPPEVATSCSPGLPFAVWNGPVEDPALLLHGTVHRPRSGPPDAAPLNLPTTRPPPLAAEELGVLGPRREAWCAAPASTSTHATSASAWRCFFMKVRSRLSRGPIGNAVSVSMNSAPAEMSRVRPAP